MRPMFRGLIDTVQSALAGADVRSVVIKVGVAFAMIGIITIFADWRLNSRMDRSGLEKLAADTASDQPAGRKTSRR